MTPHPRHPSTQAPPYRVYTTEQALQVLGHTARRDLDRYRTAGLLKPLAELDDELLWDAVQVRWVAAQKVAVERELAECDPARNLLVACLLAMIFWVTVGALIWAVTR